jgi:ABC-type phosphonate transport system ATPase subunit
VCELGLAEQLVGRTGFCIHPKETLKSVPKVGGTKSVNLKKIRELAPTHVIVNVDENRKETRWRNLYRTSSSRIRWRPKTIWGFTGRSAPRSTGNTKQRFYAGVLKRFFRR